MFQPKSVGLLLLTLSLAACGPVEPHPPSSLPADPATFTAAASGTTINLAWSAAQGADNFTLERKTTGGTYAQIASPAASVNTYADVSLSPGTAYTYRLKAVNAAGSSAGKEASATTAAVTPGAPADPANLTATVSGTSITLKWSPVSGATGYSVERRAGGGADTQIATPPAGSDHYLDPNLNPNTTYTYRVRAVNAAGSSLGKEVSATTAPATTPKTVLLVDSDNSANNANPADTGAGLSGADATYRDLLGNLNLGYDVYVVKNGQNGPSYDQMKGYKTVVWSKGLDRNVAFMTPTDLVNIAAYLDDAGHRMILSSPFFTGHFWIDPPTPFEKDVIGASKISSDWSPEDPTLSGVTGTVTAGVRLRTAISGNAYNKITLLEPAPGTDALLTTPLNPDSTTTRPVAVASGHRGVGSAKASTMIFLGFPLENVVDIGASSKQNVLQKLLAY